MERDVLPLTWIVQNHIFSVPALVKRMGTSEENGDRRGTEENGKRMGTSMISKSPEETEVSLHLEERSLEAGVR